MKLNDIRREYMQQGLSRSDLQNDPLDLFQLWMEQAIEAGVQDPTAMVLATAADGVVSQRIVLLKDFDHNGFVFFTNYSSQKAQQIDDQRRVSLLFPWIALERQIEINGVAEKISTEASAEYFRSRPRGSQIGAWASRQSSEIADRQALITKARKLDEQYLGEDVPVPGFWGGYRVIPETMEFWQGRENRLHDRFEFQLSSNGWFFSRLSP